MMIRKIMTGCAAVIVTASADAQGFVDFSSIPGVDATPIVEVNVTPLAIAILRGALSVSDPQSAELLTRLRGIQLRAYDASRNAPQFNNFIDEITEDLEEEGWESVVVVEDEASRVRILMRGTEEGISGLTVMAMDGAEAFFINVDASVSTEDLGRIMAAVGLDQAIGGMMEEWNLAPRTGAQAAD